MKFLRDASAVKPPCPHDYSLLALAMVGAGRRGRVKAGVRRLWLVRTGRSLQALFAYLPSAWGVSLPTVSACEDAACRWAAEFPSGEKGPAALLLHSLRLSGCALDGSSLEEQGLVQTSHSGAASSFQ